MVYETGLGCLENTEMFNARNKKNINIFTSIQIKL